MGMKVVEVALDKIKPYWRNPRINAEAVPVVARSIKEYGWRQPIVVDKDYTIIVGHTRYLAAKQLGLTSVPVHVASDLTEAQASAYRIADNKTAEYAYWDDAKLMAELADLKASFPDFRALGFSDEEIAELSKPPQLPEIEDFEATPIENQRWILIRAPEAKCASILAALRKMKIEDARIEYSGEEKT
jgi:ParB-like chromosome segregation protein Spo0J